MYRLVSAILAVWLLVSSGYADDGPDKDELQVRVRFKLVDDVRVIGILTSWDENGVDGSFGARRWDELRTADVWRLYRSLMDRDDAAQWLALGRLLLAIGDEEALGWGEEALSLALRLDPEQEATAANIRVEAEEIRKQREEEERSQEAERLGTNSPEANGWSADPWPVLSDEEQAAAIETMKTDASALLEGLGVELTPVETDYFLFYSDMPRRDVARWAIELDKMYRRLAQIFAIDPDENIFWGKAVILAFNDRDRFALLEAQTFRQLVPRSIAGLCHYRGPRVFINFYKQPDDRSFAALLVHETVHGFMHRYRTAKRLPTWANEGFCDYLASITFSNSPVDLDRRADGLAYVRQGYDINEALDWSYKNRTWPGPQSIGYAVGYLMVELMIRDRPAKFGAWVNAIKAGKPWEQALAEDFGVPREVLVERFTRFYQVND